MGIQVTPHQHHHPKKFGLSSFLVGLLEFGNPGTPPPPNLGGRMHAGANYGSTWKSSFVFGVGGVFVVACFPPSHLGSGRGQFDPKT